jgi:hypothetical protein
MALDVTFEDYVVVKNNRLFIDANPEFLVGD